MTRAATTLTLSIFLCLAGCDASTGGEDAGGAPPVSDGGHQADAGTPPVDGGGAGDGGDVDAGPLDPDAGRPPSTDGGPVDMGDPCAPETDLRAAVTFEEVLPHLTDAAMRNETEGELGGLGHLFADPLGDPNGKLLLWISGTDPGYLTGETTPGGPQFYTDFLRQAAGLGYHVLGLVYINEWPINAVCSRDAGDDCRERARLEVITGQDTSPLPQIDVSPADSIVNRVRAALRYRGWTQFLDDAGEPKWDLMAVGGHSQGGGHAAMVGKLFEVDRVIMTASTEYADWNQRTEDFATPGDRYYGITSMYDASRPHLLSWNNLGAPGVPTEIDDGMRPSNGSHRLITNVDPRDGNHHGTVILDMSTPHNASGQPFFRDAWCYLLGR